MYPNFPTLSLSNNITHAAPRSLHIHAETVSQEVLQRLLSNFAYQNQQISYCQGMNYVAGFLYIQLLNEQETFKVFHIIMNLYYREMFTNQFSKLKTMFYVLERR